MAVSPPIVHFVLVVDEIKYTSGHSPTFELSLEGRHTVVLTSEDFLLTIRIERTEQFINKNFK